MRFKNTLLLILFLISIQQVRAFHIIGGELSYICTGENTYELTMIMYRDCAGGGADFDNPACIGIFDATGTLIQQINVNIESITDIDITSPDPCITIPPGLCVQKGVYVFEVTLPNDTEDFTVAYQRCCRNSGIVNIETPSDVGATYWVTIRPASLFGCNNSPYFNELPPTAICVGTPLEVDHSATDPDGDSLAYRFYTPFVGGGPVPFAAPCPPESPPFGTITWVAGYSETYQIDASPALAIDPVTGLVTGTPTAEGRYVVGIAVDEFRDGELISTYYRDFQFNVQICEPLITAATTEYILNCEDFSVAFDNTSEGADDFLWEFGDGTTSTEFEPTHIYGDTGTYYVTLIANPGFTCADTFVATILIYNTLTADYSYVAGCSGTPVVFTDESVSTEAGDIVSWDWDFGDGSTSTESDPTHEYADGGTYTVTLTVESSVGCVSTVSLEVLVESGPSTDFEVDDICLDEAAEFNNLSTIVTGTITGYEWDFGDGTTSTDEDPTHMYTSAGTYEVTLTATSANGCTDEITYSISVGELPYPDAGPDATVGYLDPYTLNGSGNGTFFWTPDPPLIGLYDTISNVAIPNPTVELENTTTFYLMVISPDGCVGYDTVTIFVEPEIIVDVPSAFSPNGDGVNDEIFVFNHDIIELLEYSIYNRWGELIFTTTDIGIGWDGTVEGEDAEIGTYVYVVRAIGTDNLEQQRQGNITLVR